MEERGFIPYSSSSSSIRGRDRDDWAFWRGRGVEDRRWLVGWLVDGGGGMGRTFGGEGGGGGAGWMGGDGGGGGGGDGG